jgi:predicted O-methyltransferase YrrM
MDFAKHNEEPFLLMGCEVVEDFSEYIGEDVFEVTRRIRKFKEVGFDEFSLALSKVNDDKWEAQKIFYGESDTYVYDLLGANGSQAGIANKLNKFLPGVMGAMNGQAGSKTFMEFGGGIGVVCQMMYEWSGKEVTYIDIESPVTEFARWRFDKLGLTDKIEMKIISQDDFTLDRQYNIIFTDAVWEHLPPEKQESYIDKLAAAVEPGGLLVFIVDVDGAVDDRPMHYTVDMEKMFEIIQGQGMTSRFIHSYKNFASVWEKKE